MHKAPEEFLDYWFFPEGSYWVYKKQGTEEIDTIKVVSTREFFQEPTNDFTVEVISCEMNYVIGLKHTHSDFFYESRVLQDFPMIGYYDRDGSWFLIQNEFQANRIFEYPYVSYDNPRSENWSGFIKDTVTLSTELGELDETLVIHEGLYNMQEVYRTQNIGISAFLYFDDYWELIDYQIKNN